MNNTLKAKVARDAFEVLNLAPSLPPSGPTRGLLRDFALDVLELLNRAPVECGRCRTVFLPKRAGSARFCGAECRTAWHNRVKMAEYRAARGRKKAGRRK